MISMDSTKNSHDDGTCCNCKTGDSTRQTLSELDFERGIWYAAQSNDLQRVRQLLNKGTAVDVVDGAGYTGLHYASRNGHVEVCRELLSRGAAVNAMTRSGHATSLHRAASQGHARVVDMLLKAGANANAQDADGFTALHRAIVANSEPVCKLLVSATRLNLTDKYGRTPKQLAEEKDKLHLFE
ncbi:ankyrin repeat domain-containing protein 39 [Phymastichus coffea]|uniref:ankyrin repeat domain-containing protein 39 n=1 Tax=Phymastichus coffea TaxID=108790 RepID=UPI00273CCB98|nr:ankyrin repeat domain-containing protein 39 [Phymastichus coffea]